MCDLIEKKASGDLISFRGKEVQKKKSKKTGRLNRPTHLLAQTTIAVLLSPPSPDDKSIVSLLSAYGT